jgi:5-epi-alpha-selinene synthase
MSNIEWPRLYCPFPSALNQHTAEAHRETLRWATVHGLVVGDDVRKTAQAEKYTWLVGRFYPSAPRACFQLLSDFTSWLFWHDDVCDETEIGHDPARLEARFRQLYAVLAGDAAARADPYEVSLADMRGRFIALAPDPAWISRFLASVYDYFEGCLWEAHNRARQIVPRVADFIPMRRCAGGMWIYLDFIELVNQSALPLLLRKHRDIRRLRQIANNVACWHNDLFSFSKEKRRGDVHNLVTALEADLQLSVPEAVQLAGRYCDAEAHNFVALESKLPPFEPPLRAALVPYLAGLKALMRGNLDWSLESGRYATGITAAVA